jgi:hypothetical protein
VASVVRGEAMEEEVSAGREEEAFPCRRHHHRRRRRHRHRHRRRHQRAQSESLD